MASTTIQRTPSSSGSNTVFTMSMWIKRSGLGAAQCLWSNGGSPQGQMSILAGDDLIVYDGSTTVINTNRKFRDVTAWYHIVLTCDAGASGDDKVKLYVNGVLETSFATDNRSSFSDLNNVNQSGQEMSIGSNGASGQYFDGVMSHINLIDGTAYAASDFGETDADTGEWKIKTSPSVTYGTNGFFLKMEDSSNMDLDSSSNALTFTTSGNLTATEDCPSDNFATLNNLFTPTPSDANYGMSFSNGNTSVNPTSPDANGSRNYTCSTLAMKTSGGKYYAEFKINPSNDLVGLIGLVGTQQATERFHYNNKMTDCLNGIAYDMAADRIRGNSTDIVGSLTAAASNDIVGIGIDMDNKLFYAYLNGTLLNSGGSSFSFFTEPFAYFCLGDSSTSGYDGYQANFGNGYFGTTAISSEGTNASGIGKFEYDVPSGFTALSTKGLNE